MFYELKVNGEEHKIFAQRVGQTLWYHFKGEVFSHELVSKRKNYSGGEDLIKSNDLVAQLPGKIIKVAVQSGDQIKKGQTLIIMEAMKMEYKFNAHSDGQVENVLVAENDQVTSGQLLVKLSSGEANES